MKTNGDKAGRFGARDRLSRFSGCRSGIMFLKFALMLPLVLAIILSGIDYAWTLTHKAVLQDAADTAAIAGAKQLSMADAKHENVEAVVTAMVERYIADNRKSLIKKGAIAPIVKAKVSSDPLQVEVSVTQGVKAAVGGTYGLEFPPINVKSVARILGRPNICVLALDPSANGALSLEHRALVTGRNCAVYSNSSHATAIQAKNSATLTASFICSRGGKSGGPGNFSPEPMVDCPGFDDPLADRPEPLVGPCLSPALVQGAENALVPGTYCGGLTLEGGTITTLLPGVYTFKDGPLIVEDGATLTGVDIGLHFSGRDAYFEFHEKTTISLKAPTTGVMAGLLVFESRNNSTDARHKLLSNNALMLLGTIYIPQGELHVDAESPIASESAYTAIIARTMRLFGGPHLVLNSNYDQTNVPVPKGIRGAGQPVSLVQ